MAIFTPELLHKLKVGYYFWPIFFVGSVIYSVIYYIINLWNMTKDLKWIKGPPRIPFIGNAMNFIGHSYSEHFKMSTDWLDKYDGIAQIWIFHRPTVLISRSEIVERLLKGVADTLTRKSEQYKFINNFTGKGLLTSSAIDWNARRKVMNPFFNSESIHGFISKICLHSRSLTSNIKDKCKNNAIVDLQEYTETASFDVNMDVLADSMSKNSNEKASFFEALKTASEIVMKRTFTPFYNWSIIYLFTLTKLVEYQAAKTINNFTLRVIGNKKKLRQAKSTEGSRQSLVDFLLDNKEAKSLKDNYVHHELNTFLFTSCETISSGIAFTLYLIGRHPEIQERLIQEIKSVIPDLSLEKEPTSAQLMELQLLDRCIKEGLRLYPPVPWIGRELKNNIKIDDARKLPRDISIAISIYNLHRNEKYFKNPNTFDPDRFLQFKDDQENFTYMPFGTGWRSCIGKNLAIMEMKIIIAHILSNFAITSLEKPEDLEITGNLVLRSVNGLRVRINPRNT